MKNIFGNNNAIYLENIIKIFPNINKFKTNILLLNAISTNKILSLLI